MTQVNIHDAKIHLSKLIERVLQGGEVIIARVGKPLARLMAIKSDMGFGGDML